MINRSDSQRSGSSRPYSANNPFRSAATDSSLTEYQTDQDFQNWVSTNAINAPYGGRKNGSTLSFTDSIEEEPDFYSQMPIQPQPVSRGSYNMTPPPRPASNNPFLDDLSAESTGNSFESNTNKPQPPNYMNNNDKNNYPTAQEEKDRLRKKYIEQRSVSTSENEDLPPSYEEVAGTAAARSSHPREKARATSSRDTPDARHHSSSSRRRSESGNGERRHRNGGSSSHNRRERDGTESHAHHSSSRRHRSSKDKKSSSPTKKVVPKNVDTIDKLDVTGLFGGAFHHDGPFDACTPHRNKNNKVAPVLAFPADGPNSSISGATANKSAMNEVFGRDDIDDDDAYLYKSRQKQGDVSVMSRVNASNSTLDAIRPNANNITQFDAKAKTELVHGPTTVGLGSTTFLDGAPAVSTATREDSMFREHRTGGLQRKKSLNQKLRNTSNNGDAGYKNNYDSYRPDQRQQGNLKLTKTHSGYLEKDTSVSGDNGEDEDVYLGVRFDSNPKKESSGNKFLRRVKSLKVGRKG